MLNKIFSTLKLWKQEKIDYKVYKKRIQALPEDYQIVFKEIEAPRTPVFLKNYLKNILKILLT